MPSEKNLRSIFSDIAAEIREKLKNTDVIKPYNMAEKIRDIKGGLIQVDSIPENNYDTTSIYELPYNFNDLLISTKIPDGPNESILFSEMLKGAPIIIAGGEVVNELPTENIIESTQTNGLYFYYSLIDNEVYMYSVELFNGWMPMSSYFYQMFDGLLMPCKGIINTEFDDVVLGHGYYVINKKYYYKYFKHWEEITYSGDGSDVIDAGYNLPEKDTNKDKVYKVKYFDDIYLVLEEGKVGYYLNNNLFLICGIDVCETIPTYNPVYPLNSDVNDYQHFYYVKNDDIYLYVNSTDTKGFFPVRITFNAGDESGPIQFKGEVDKNNNVNNTTQGIYAAYTYRYYRNTDSSKQFKYNGKELTATPSTEEQIFEAKGVDYFSKVTVGPVTSDIDSNIAPENIAKDVTILGVTGTLEVGIPGTNYYLPDSSEKYNLDIVADEANLNRIDITSSTTGDTNINIFATEATTNVSLNGGSNGGLTGTININDTGYAGTIVANNLVPENIAKGKRILGVEGTLESGGGGSGGENTLKALLDTTKRTNYLFGEYNGTSIDGLIKKEDTSNVTNMDNMFYYCQYLTSIPELNTSNVTSMRNMFTQCINLKSIPQLDTSNVTRMSDMFQHCSSLTSIPQLNTSKVEDIGYMFRYCYLLNKIDITHMNTSIFSAYFADNCKSLTKLIIRNMTSAPSLHSKAFNNCYHFTGTADQTYNPTGLKDGRIYVPDDMVDILKSATNWSTYADIIVPLSTLEEE